MKKLIYLLMLALPCLMMGACENEVVRKVQQTKDGGLSDGFLHYKITSNTSESWEVMVSGSEEHAIDVEIPTAVEFNGEKYQVTSIGDQAFCNPNLPDTVVSYLDYPNINLTSISIPNSVTSIGDGAFWGCSRLTSITIPNSVTSIEPYTFQGCSGLTSITIPNSVTSIGSDAFDGCTSLPVIDNIRYADCYAVEAADKSLTSYKLKEGTRFIGNAAFSDCINLTTITIPNSVTSIEYRAFSGCTGLTSITIPEGVTSIGSFTFSNCSGLTSITIPEGVTSIEYRAFSGCTGLTSITIPEGVTSIEWGAFSGCSGLTSITIPEGVTSIGESAFSGCTGLTSITIPNSVTSIGENAFKDCYPLTDVTCLTKNPPMIDKLEERTSWGTLHVLPGCKAAYEKSKWKQYFKNIVEDAVE